MILDEIAVIVIGRNEGERLVRCLKSVSLDSHIVIYVDSGSSDDSVRTAEGIGACVVRLDPNSPFTAARARNEGFKLLRTVYPSVRFVQFTDGDCTLDRGWLDKARAFIDSRNDIAVVCGRLRELYPTASIYNRLCDMEWDTPIGDVAGCGGNALIRVEAFEAAKGFQADLIAGEEPELCVRLREVGWKIWRLDTDMGRHDAAMTRIGQFWTRAVRGGYAYAEVSRLHRGSPYVIWRRETARAIIWGGLLPVIICLGTLIHPAALAGILAYAFQMCRIAFARGPHTLQSWTYALFITASKFAEFQGILKFCWRQIAGRSIILIEHK